MIGGMKEAEAAIGKEAPGSPGGRCQSFVLLQCCFCLCLDMNKEQSFVMLCHSQK